MEIDKLAEIYAATQQNRVTATGSDNVTEFDAVSECLVAIDKMADEMRATIGKLRRDAEALRKVDHEAHGWLERMLTVANDFAMHLKNAEATLPQKFKTKSK